MAHIDNETDTALDLRLIGAPQAIAKMRRSALFGALTGGKGRWERFRTSAFPTETDDLKADAPPDTAHAQLAPKIAVITDRWTARIKYQGASIECVFDFSRPEVFGGPGAPDEARSQIRLRLRKGHQKMLFGFARLLIGEGALRPVAVAHGASENDVLGDANKIRPAQKPVLSGEETAGEALQKALVLSAHRVTSLSPLIVDARMEAGIHQMRVVLRRIRAVERLYRPYTHNEQMRRLAKAARTAARKMGPARDWDVFLAETLPGITADGYSAQGFGLLKIRAEHHRAEAWDKAVNFVAGRKFRLFMLDLLEAAHLAPGKEAAAPAMRQPVRAFSRQALEQHRQAAAMIAKEIIAKEIDPQSLAARHRLRIALKRLRYTAQAYHTLYPKAKRKSYMKAMSNLQTALGGVNDALTAQRLSDQAAKGQGDEAMRAAGYVYGSRAFQLEGAACAADRAFSAFTRQTPFWNMAAK